MLVVAGLSLKNLHPRVWDEGSAYYLPTIKAIMVSYAEFHRMPRQRRTAMDRGLRAYLGAPAHVKIYLDNGAFYFLTHQGETPRTSYEEFVKEAKPDWWPIPQDYIPGPQMTLDEQYQCLRRTMAMNLAYKHDGYVPVIHVSRVIDEYIVQVAASEDVSAKPKLGLGGIVPNLLRAPKAMPYREVLHSLARVRGVFANKELHLFGVGGTATLHLAALLAIDSVDSSGWRNRAARGIVQLPGSGDRMVANMGSWRGRVPSSNEWETLAACTCPPCRQRGLESLQSSGIEGFCHRATHNLSVLLNEAQELEVRLADGTYAGWYATHLDNSIYRTLIEQALALRQRQ